MTPPTAASNKPDKKASAALRNLRKLLAFDRELIETSAETRFPISTVMGTDEVGRGCLAGPVVACAVILPPIDKRSALEKELALLNDSKLVPVPHRERMADVLKGCCRFAIAEASVAEIDDINILQASLLAMKRAVAKLGVIPGTVLLVDGNKKVPKLRVRQTTVIGGDSKSASIAAASIIAKVYRDDLMRKLAEEHPEFLWDSNKGYQSKEHYRALGRLGPTAWHRRSFNLGLDRPAEDAAESDTLISVEA